MGLALAVADQTEEDMNTLELSAKEFLAELFEYEYCELCLGDVADHVAGPDMFGNWHAWCLNGEDWT